MIASLSPVSDAEIPTNPHARETVEERSRRYREIAEDLVAVVESEPEIAPDVSKALAYALLVSTAFYESGFRRDVDLGEGKRSRGRDGVDHCLMQVRVMPKRRTAEGWTGDDLVRDRQKCFRAALRKMRESFQMCRAKPLEERLAAYVSGRCNIAVKNSRNRYGTAERLLRRLPAPGSLPLQ